MTAVLISMLAALLLPYFARARGGVLVALAAQGVALAGYALARDGVETSVLTLLDAALVRALAVPWALRAPRTSTPEQLERQNLFPSLVMWGLAPALVFFAFQFTAWAMPQPTDERLALAVAVSGVLLSLFLLATSSGLFSQMAAALSLENSIRLFELSGSDGDGHGVQWAQLLIVALTVWSYRWQLRSAALGDPRPGVEGPTL